MTLAKTDVSGIYKERDGVLINKDNEALRAYKMSKLQHKKTKLFEAEFESLKEDMKEIKQMLAKLVH